MNKMIFKPYVQEVLRGYDEFVDRLSIPLLSEMIYDSFVLEQTTLRVAVEKYMWFVPEGKRLEIYREINEGLL